MKVKTSELIGAALDWAVAKCEGEVWATWRFNEARSDGEMHYSTDWLFGGPIIEREGLRLHRSHTNAWWAGSEDQPQRPIEGLTPLIAAMRCYVGLKLGNEVDVPDELFEFA